MDGNMVGGPTPDRPIDDSLIERASASLHEACDRATFHRVETERWERIARSEAAALRELQAQGAVAQFTPEEAHGRDSEAQYAQPGAVAAG